MLGNIGDLFVKCMRQVTKSHLYHLLGVSDYIGIYRPVQGTVSFVKRQQRSPTQLLLQDPLSMLKGLVTNYREGGATKHISLFIRGYCKEWL